MWEGSRGIEIKYIIIFDPNFNIYKKEIHASVATRPAAARR